MRALPALLILALLVLVLGGLVFFFSYGFEDTPPRRMIVAGLEAPVRIGWEEQTSIAHIRAENRRDAFAALGFVHGTRHAWTATLWRQTALGRLGEWFGRDVLALDSLARKLRFADLARQTYTALPTEQQGLLDAYARGLTAALRTESRPVGRTGTFVLLDIQPAAWAPWHTLAVERLLAWLSAKPPAPERLTAAGPDLAAFFEANRRLHRWLALHGFSHSLAFAVDDTAGTHFYQRQVYGATALPLLQEIVLTVGDDAPLLGASLPGTPFFPAGRTGAHAWAVLPSTAVTLERTTYDSTAVRRAYERLTDTDGTEYLLSFRYLPDALPLGRPPALPTADTRPTMPPSADSTWTVRWPGFSIGTDLDAFLALLEGQPATFSAYCAPDKSGAGRAPARTPFQLLEGDGLCMDSTGTATVMGDPQVVERLPAGLLIGNTFWAHYAADQLRTLADPDGRAAFEQWTSRDSSTWAARTTPVLLASLDSLARLQGGVLTSEQSTGIFNDALMYLRNWNFTYDPASIGASIYDTWVRAYHRTPRQLLHSPAADTSARVEWIRRYEALQRAVAALVQAHGRDLRTWRWESVMPDVRRFPGWTADSSSDAVQTSARTRYAPIHLPGRGHPSSLSWGPSLLDGGPPAPAVWEAWISTARWERLYVRRRRFQTDTFLGRYRAPHQRPAPITVEAKRPTQENVTRLLPP